MTSHNNIQPLTETDWLWYETTAASINEKYPADLSLIKGGDFTAWAQEGYDLAVSTVYPSKCVFLTLAVVPG